MVNNKEREMNFRDFLKKGDEAKQVETPVDPTPTDPVDPPTDPVDPTDPKE